ncbi:unnamed protein product [Rhodiola kirilowii]
MGHVNLRTLQKIASDGLVRGIPKVQGELSIVCGDCQIGKQIKVPHKRTTQINTSRPLIGQVLDLLFTSFDDGLGLFSEHFVII